MNSPLRARAVRFARSLLAKAVHKSPSFRKLAERTVAEVERALIAPDLYGSRYFEPKPGRDEKSSGYLDYRRETSNLDVGAYIIFKHLRPERVLDLGAAQGFLLEAFEDLGIEAFGIDLSEYPIRIASDSTRRRMVVASATHLPFPPGFAPVVSAFETLEHLAPRLIASALREIHRVTSAFVVATIPSFGTNDHGPDGWFAGKVRWEVLDHYLSLAPHFEGPVPFYDLMRDREGNPIEGHLTIASFSWWTKRFEEAGLLRCGELEERINSDLGRYGLLGDQIWNLYVFRRPEAELPQEVAATSEEIAWAESVLKLPDVSDLEN